MTAEYFNNTRLEGIPKVRKEGWINFEPANQAPDPFLPKSPLSIRWTGKLKPTISGRYTFSFTSDDGCRLRINDQLLIDAWNGHSVAIDSVSIELEAGKNISYRQNIMIIAIMLSQNCNGKFRKQEKLPASICMEKPGKQLASVKRWLL